MKLAVTGGSGYIGERLLKLATARGHEVLAFARRKPVLRAAVWVPYELTDSMEIRLPPGIDAIVHLAATATRTAIEVDTEIRAAQRLITAARHSSCQFVFISSQTARPDAPTPYGVGKWRIEQEVLAAGGIVIRPGLVYGAREQGLFGQLAATLRKLPLLPVFLPAPRVQPVHVDDLAAAILAAVELPGLPSGIFCIGAPVAVTFTGFLRCLARQWLRRFRVGVPVPVALVSLARSVAHGLGLATPALDRLASLFALPVMASADDLAELGISLRPLVRGMARSGNDARRRLLAEGRALLMYTLREEPSPVLLRRYVRVRTRLGHGAALFLPALFLRFPSLLSLLASSRNTALSGCLQTAIAIGEASPQGARRYLRLGQASGLFRAIVHITSALATELWWRGLRVCCRPLLRRLRRRSELSE